MEFWRTGAHRTRNWASFSFLGVTILGKWGSKGVKVELWRVAFSTSNISQSALEELRTPFGSGVASQFHCYGGGSLLP